MALACYCDTRKGGAPINIELTLRANDQPALEHEMATMLRKCGWVVQAGGHWQTIKDLRYEYGVSSSLLSMQLRRFKGEFPREYGESGRRITRLQQTSELREYLGRLNGVKQ